MWLADSACSWDDRSGSAEQEQAGAIEHICPVYTTSHLKNCAPVGPSAMILLASPSSSARGGGVLSFWGLTRRQVMRVGAAHVLGGITTLSPLWRLPRIEPPLASTMKLTRNLEDTKSLLGFLNPVVI